MENQTRRDFIKQGFYAALGTGAIVILGRLGLRHVSQNVIPSPPAGPDYIPTYVKLHKSGTLKKRGEQLWEIMRICNLCPRECLKDRFHEEGLCHSTDRLKIASFHPHFGEERPLVGRGGSGTIFFSNCSLRCIYCINGDISLDGHGKIASIDKMAEMMLALQKQGCHNINIVTPVHYSPHILLALDKAAAQGLRLPLIYNTSGWERVEILKKLDGVVDIYLPDFKYADSAMAFKYSSEAKLYAETTKKALLEMYRQVGTATPAKDGIIYRGLIIRHLVLPNNVGGTKEILQWIGKKLPKNTYVNLMSQYAPVHKAPDFPDISRRITQSEYNEAIRWAKEAGLTNIDYQRRTFAG